MDRNRRFARPWRCLLLASRVALFICIYVLLDTSADAILARVAALKVVQPVAPLVGLVRETVALTVVLSATGIMAMIERRPLRDYGYRSENGFRRFGAGLACGLLALSALIGCMALTGVIRFTGINLSSVGILRDAVIWAAVFLMIGMLEESIFRGYPQHALSRGVGFWWAALFVSGAFMAWHLQNDGETPLGLLATGLGSFAFCLSLWYTRSLWWAIGSTPAGTAARASFMEPPTAAW